MDASVIRHIKLERCTGCRSCEVACSFHHIKAFDPKHSSIQINVDKNTWAISLTIYSTCDHCVNEEKPLCEHFCTSGVLGSPTWE
jgi:Fe-S-cluster-containing hydrogenase component 2